MNIMNDNNKLINGFKRHFGDMQVSLYHACGRTELGGNHTDHQNGQVLASAVDISMAAAVTSAENVEIYSEGFGALKLDVSELSMREDEKGTAPGLVRGVLAGLKDQGFKVGGFKAYITSDIPEGAGLSSSAAFEILIGRIVSGVYNDGAASYVELAQIGQFAENVYYGKPCGLMDQIVCASGKTVYIDFAYEGCPIIEEIDFDFSACGYEMCITNTGGSHADLTAEYASVTEEMRAVAEMFGQEKLRGITSEQLINRASEVRKIAGDRALLRALHFTEESERAKAEAEALKDDDFIEFLRLVKASGDSSYKLLQNVYAGTDQPIAIGLAVSELVMGGDGVCRVHGGGFAGSIQAFIKSEAVKKYKAAMDDLFGDGACRVLKLGAKND